MNTLDFKKLDDRAILPTRSNPTDAGLDLYAVSDDWIYPKSVTSVRTGIAVAIPTGYVGLVHPRSGLAFKHGITVVNAPGTIDSDYRGEIRVALTTLTDRSYRITAGDRIAQLVIQKIELPAPTWVDELSDTERGIGGFGSTGL